MKQKLAIYCIGSNSQGFGNFNRSLLLAKALKNNSVELFFIFLENKIIQNKLLRNNFRFYSIKNSKKYSVDTQIKKIVEKEQSHYIIIDARESSELLSKKLFLKSLKVIVIDDAWIHNVYADMLINGTPIKKYHSYKKINSNCKLLLGSKYWIMNPNFKKYKKSAKKISQKVKYHLVITMGGSDHHNMTQKVLKSLLFLDNLTISVVIGPFYKNEHNLIKILKNTKNVTLINSPNNIWTIFQKSDLVISGSGSTLFELASQGIPTITIELIKHQIPYAKFFKLKGFSVDCGFWKDFESASFGKMVEKTLNNYKLRKKMSSNGIKLFDGNGLNRVSKEIGKFLN